MPTVTTGIFFLGTQRPESRNAGEAFELVLRVLDRLSPTRVELYRVKWTGIDACAWWHQHQHTLRAGQPLQMELHNPRAESTARTTFIEATVARCDLAPPSASWVKNAAQQTAPHPI